MTRRFSDALVDVQAYGNQRAGEGRGGWLLRNTAYAFLIVV